MRRLVILLTLAVVALATALPSPASAAAPIREPLPIDDLVISDVCSFTVIRTVLVNKSFLTTYSNGDQRITGIFKQRLTNDDTGEFIDLTSPGPVLLDYHDDGSITEIDYGPQFERPPGQLLLTTGRVVWEYEDNFEFVSYTQLSGSTRDVCEILA
jgi:hypothetical protein